MGSARDLKIGDVVSEIPHEFKEYGKIFVNNDIKKRGYTIIPLGVKERAGYLVFKKVDEGLKLVCFATLLKYAIFYIKQDSLEEAELLANASIKQYSLEDKEV